MSKFFKIFLLSVVILLIISSCKTSTTKKRFFVANTFNNLYIGKGNTILKIEQEILTKSISGNSYDFMSLRDFLGGMNVLIIKTNDETYINNQCVAVDNIVNSSQVSRFIKGNQSYRDSYRGWVALNTNEQNKSTKFNEIPLFESYSFFYITQFLYILQENGWKEKSAINKQWWENTLNFIEKNEWEKWYERSYNSKGNHYWGFLRSRTHMGSHWAGIAMYLSKMSRNADKLRQYEELRKQYDILLNRNLKLNLNVPSAYVWNSTYDNTEGTDAIKQDHSIMQDVSHGNHVVTYVIASYELDSTVWRRGDISKLCSTFKNVIYNKSTNIFADNVDGTIDNSRPGWGSFVADGWSKLSKYDVEIEVILNEAVKDKKIQSYNQGLQLKVNLMEYTK